ncbi:type II toxin-antitoxin system RelE family toxin [Halotalea alkalilenta]|uniref:type II toxin-antitoxin system RelE family toxin n=1 Tax=Halotalea alkalilenta TaxID=376489 RepID=UPI000487A553|nr:type II toxin-antitoxin system RelE/ParE family toxin [Halotalea alkalilenta]
MKWKVEYASSVQKEIRQLDPQTRQRIRTYMEQRLMTIADPRQLGKPLKGQFSTLWRYRVSDYRIVCDLDDHVLTILVLRVAHRRQVYD